MNWFLMLWPMAAAASLTLALVHFWRWLGQRDERANLLFSVAATATAGVALFELMIARADRKSTRLNSSHIQKSRMPSSA